MPSELGREVSCSISSIPLFYNAALCLPCYTLHGTRRCIYLQLASGDFNSPFENISLLLLSSTRRSGLQILQRGKICWRVHGGEVELSKRELIPARARHGKRHLDGESRHLSLEMGNCSRSAIICWGLAEREQTVAEDVLVHLSYTPNLSPSTAVMT